MLKNDEEPALDFDAPAAKLCNHLDTDLTTMLVRIYDTVMAITKERSLTGREIQIFGNMFIWCVMTDLDLNEHMLELGLLRQDIESYVERKNNAGKALFSLANPAEGAKYLLRLRDFQQQVQSTMKAAQLEQSFQEKSGQDE